MNIKVVYIALIFLLLEISYAHSQERSTEISVDFRVNKTHIDTSYRNNAERVSNLISFLEQVQTDSTIHIVRISFCGAASPEGSYELNRMLAKGRMKSLEKLVRSKVEIPDNIITYDDSYIPWEYLVSQISESEISHKQEILSIIKGESEIVNYHNGRIDSRILKLQKLNGGKVWKDMLHRFFSPMRNACVVFVTVKRKALPEIEPVTTKVDWAPTLPVLLDSIQPIRQTPTVIETRKPFYMAVKTNMLEDLLLVPNIGMEFYLGKGITIGGNWKYAWWHSDRKHNYWRIYGGDINVRKYFGRKAEEKPLQGHHIGVYGQIVTYDFELGGKGIMGGVPGGTLFDKFNYGGGIEYGYSHPIAKRLNLDFTIGLGYFGGQYREYESIDDCYVWKATKHRHYWGPTKAEVSLVWLIDHGNVNKRKGGKR